MDVLLRPLNAYDKPDLDFFIEYLMKQLDISKTEATTVRLILKGMNNREMSEHRFVSVKATKFQLTNLYKKLNVRNKHQAVIRIIMLLNSHIPMGEQCQKSKSLLADQE